MKTAWKGPLWGGSETETSWGAKPLRMSDRGMVGVQPLSGTVEEGVTRILFNMTRKEACVCSEVKKILTLCVMSY